MTTEKKYYMYTYNFGDKDIEIKETDFYTITQLEDHFENEVLNKTDVFINSHGVYRFYMYSDSKDNVDTFLNQISEILANEMNTASHLYQLASGRFNVFDNFWKEYEKR